jgi:hypothetical protein
MEFVQDQDFLRGIRRHFVSLSGTCVDLQGAFPREERMFCCSGFVIEICGVWCFVTAGHVFNEIDNGIRSGKIRLLKCSLADYYAAEAVDKEPIHFDYEGAHRITVEAGGMDVGLIALRDYYRINLSANGVRPMPVADWVSCSPPPFEHYAVLGLPTEQLELRTRMGDRGPQIGYMTTLTLAGVQALPSPPPDRIESPIPRFAGLLNDRGQLGSVKGMSGGPILGVSRCGMAWPYACVAVQGSWDVNRRLIYGTPVSIVVDAITKILRRQGASQAGNG